jgi:hypothetical protein
VGSLPQKTKERPIEIIATSDRKNIVPIRKSNLIYDLEDRDLIWLYCNVRSRGSLSHYIVYSESPCSLRSDNLPIYHTVYSTTFNKTSPASCLADGFYIYGIP